MCDDVCDKHPKYQGIRSPRKPCLSCWMFYFSKNPDKLVKASEMADLLHALINEMILTKRRASSAASSADAALYVANLAR